MEPDLFVISSSDRLKESFFLRDTIVVAKELIGKIIVRNIGDTRLSAIITETEAYLGSGDSASHSAPGRTKRNGAMFRKGGVLYVYKIYGIHHCINIVTEDEGIGSAVLIRSGIPVDGIDTMSKNRKVDNRKQLLKGPGNFAKAFGFTMADNFSSLISEGLFVNHGFKISSEDINSSKRIGITKASDKILRFYLKNSEYVSGGNNYNIIGNRL